MDLKAVRLYVEVVFGNTADETVWLQMQNTVNETYIGKTLETLAVHDKITMSETKIIYK